MATIGKISRVNNISDAKAVMAELLLDWKESILPDHPIVRLEIELEQIDPLDWLIKQTLPGRIYWRQRNESFVTAGVGVSDNHECDRNGCYQKLLQQISDKLSNSKDNIRYYGGFRFDQNYENPSDEWKAFGAGRLTLPRFEVTNRNEKSLFICNLIPARDKIKIDQILDDLSKINDDKPDQLPLPKLSTRTDFPDIEGWRKIVDHSLNAFEQTELEKIVLARCSNFEFDSEVDPVLMLKRLAEVAVDCFHFCFEPVERTQSSASTFFGATPELLYARENHTLKTEAVAGTRPRGKDQQSDLKYEKSLLGCEKDIREQNHVVTDIKYALKKLGTLTNTNGNGHPRLLKLARVQHLITRFESELNSQIGDGEILQEIHPTPAVGGCPRKLALENIRVLEPFDRGWYAGPVGWISKDSATFAVGIRSGLIKGNIVKLYSGAGIVRGSTAEREWKEIENKLKSYLEIV